MGFRRLVMETPSRGWDGLVAVAGFVDVVPFLGEVATVPGRDLLAFGGVEAVSVAAADPELLA